MFKAVNSNERKILKKRTTFIRLHTKSYAIKHYALYLSVNVFSMKVLIGDVTSQN